MQWMNFVRFIAAHEDVILAFLLGVIFVSGVSWAIVRRELNKLPPRSLWLDDSEDD